MKGMFYICSSLNNLNVTNFDTKNVSNMKGMFYNCKFVNELNDKQFNIKEVFEEP